MEAPNQDATRKRKVRAIYDSIVETDDVKVDAGHNYANWINIVKSKLREREMRLMHNRLQLCCDVVVSETAAFVIKYGSLAMTSSTEPTIEEMISSITERCDLAIGAILNAWNGVRTTKRFTSFRGYFQCSRRWFDQRKISVLAFDLCIPLFKAMDKFARHKVTTEYADYFELALVRALLEAKMKHANARPMFLLPASVYIYLVRQPGAIIQLDGAVSRSTGNNMIRYQFVQKVCAKKLSAQQLLDNAIRQQPIISTPKPTNKSYKTDQAYHMIDTSINVQTRISQSSHPTLSMPCAACGCICGACSAATAAAVPLAFRYMAQPETRVSPHRPQLQQETSHLSAPTTIMTNTEYLQGNLSMDIPVWNSQSQFDSQSLHMSVIDDDTWSMFRCPPIINDTESMMGGSPQPNFPTFF